MTGTEPTAIPPDITDRIAAASHFEPGASVMFEQITKIAERTIMYPETIQYIQETTAAMLDGYRSAFMRTVEQYYKNNPLPEPDGQMILQTVLRRADGMFTKPSEVAMMIRRRVRHKQELAPSRHPFTNRVQGILKEPFAVQTRGRKK